jgi:hypothetical protein
VARVQKDCRATGKKNIQVVLATIPTLIHIPPLEKEVSDSGRVAKFQAQTKLSGLLEIIGY